MNHQAGCCQSYAMRYGRATALKCSVKAMYLFGMAKEGCQQSTTGAAMPLPNGFQAMASSVGMVFTCRLKGKHAEGRRAVRGALSAFLLS